MLFLNHPLVRAHYLKHGRVYTLRAKRRKRDGLQAVVQGSRFKHRPVGRGVVVLVRELKILSPRSLASSVRRSGFKSSKDWMEAYVQINGGKLIQPVYIYEVVKALKKAAPLAKRPGV